MVFGTFLWILILFVPLQTSPEFVVQEIRACCHHRIVLQCKEQSYKMAILQARYTAAGGPENTSEANSNNSFRKSRTSTSRTYAKQLKSLSPQEHLSLWDLDIQFAHDLIKADLEPPHHVNTLPEWHPDHSSHIETRRRFMYPRITLPPKFPNGLNHSSEKVLEMPLYDKNFLDQDTIWRQPLFPKAKVDYSANSFLNPSERRSMVEYFREEDRCLSYQTLMQESSLDATTPVYGKDSSWKSDSETLPWTFQDLRPFFNRRCSGKSSCEVHLLNNKQSDQDVTRVCDFLPGGRIAVKYLCYDSSSEISHAKCNVDVTPAREGFLMNPGYPDLYPGDLPCQWRLHVPQQKILLIFLDISLRGQDKLQCKDELLVTDEFHSKLLSACGDHLSAIAVLSETHQLNVTLRPQSRLAYPKRGFLAYYRVIGCMDPVGPTNSYMVFRNATHAYFTCDVGHIFPDTVSRDRWLFCSPLDHTWLGNFPFCHDIRVERNFSIEELLRNDPTVWAVKDKDVTQTVLAEFVAPVLVILGVFALHGVILYIIWRHRSRLEEIENQTNQEMERMICGRDSPEESIFSFPDSLGENIWDDDEDDLGQDDTDQDRTLTTLTVQTETPPSSSAIKGQHYFELNNGNGHLRYFLNRENSSSSRVHSSGTLRSNVGYTNGNVLSVSFTGYFRTTAV